VSDADHIVPAVDRDLAGDHERAGVVTILDNFEKIARLFGLSVSGPQSSRMSSFAREIVRRSLA